MADQQTKTSRGRVRDVLPHVRFGKWPVGQLNSITDVPGVLVSVQSIQPTSNVNTGVTVVLPRPDWQDFCCTAGIFNFNGCGELTGSHWIEETGLLSSPIVITGTSGVGDAYRGVQQYIFENCSDDDGESELFILPVVGETFDGFLSPQGAFAVRPEHVVHGIKTATADRVPEGNTGGGTGMICHRFKGGTGSSSRLVKGHTVDGKDKDYTVGVLVQANYGATENLSIAGVPVGRILVEEKAPPPIAPEAREARKDGSIIIILATDAPLTPVQLQRLAKRAAIGLGKVGGYGSNTSGDIFLAFSTADKIPTQKMTSQQGHPYVPEIIKTSMADDFTITGLFEAAADATEEAIYNSLCMAETMTGFKDRTVQALDLDRLKAIFAELPKGWW
ncbi:peptidase family s58 domain-containing protein [Sarocladium implicatum]|nr:peptidase family s58 domain-containing protein [Sarocladium implicatum]